MQGLTTLASGSLKEDFEFYGRVNGLDLIDEHSFVKPYLTDGLSEISENHTIFEHSFIEFAAQQQSSILNRTGMQVEDFRAHEMRDEEMMLSFDEFCELSSKLTNSKREEASPLASLDQVSSASSDNFDGMMFQVKNRLERELEELNIKVCCMKLQGANVSKFGVLMTESQNLLEQLIIGVKRTSKAYTSVIAKSQQLDIQTEKTRVYRAKLKERMAKVKEKATQLNLLEQSLIERKDKSFQLTQIKQKLSKMLADDKNDQGEVEETPKSVDFMNKLARSNTSRTQLSQEKVNKILEETQRQNQTFHRMMPKLAVTPVKKYREAHSTPTKSRILPSEENTFEARERDLKDCESHLRDETLKLIRLKQELLDLMPCLELAKH